MASCSNSCQAAGFEITPPGQTPASPPSGTRFGQPWVVAGLLFLATLALFSPVLGSDFIDYDDTVYVFQNEHVARGFTWAGVKYAFTTLDGAIWMPLTWLSYFLDTTLFGTGPAGYHFTSVAFHSASAALLFLALQRMTRQIWPALFVAVLFAWHPQRSESVAWVAERKDVVCVFFWMLGLLAYSRYAARPGPGRMAWVGGCLVLGGLAKPMVVSFPLILLLLDFWPLQRCGGGMVELRGRVWPLVREKLPLLVIVVLLAMLAVWGQSQQGAVAPVHFAWYLKLFRVFENLGFYCQSFFVPSGLAIVYRVEKLKYLHCVLAGGALTAVSLLVLWRAWRWPWLVLGWFWFLFAVAPVAGFFRVGTITVADRYSYLPSVGLAVAVVWSLVVIGDHGPGIRRAMTSLLALWVVVCALATRADLPRWRDSYSVFMSAYYHGAHYVACDHAASFLYARHDFQGSLAACDRGLETSDCVSLYNTRAYDYLMLGNLDQALTNFNQALRFSPDYADAYYGRAMVHLRRNQFAEAREDAANHLKYGGKLDLQALKLPPP